MASACSDTSFISSTTSSQGSEPKSQDSIDSNLSSGSMRKAVEKSQNMESENLKQFQKMFSDALIQQSKSNRSSLDLQDPLALHRGLESIASSLSLLTETLGRALEEQMSLVEMKGTGLICTEPEGTHTNESTDNLIQEKQLSSPSKIQVTPEKRSEEATKQLSSPPKIQVSPEKRSEVTKDTKMKTSRDVAAAMTTKAKLLLRELKRIRQDLTFTKERCTQLEDENRRLRESIDKGVRHEEDDLVRLQLEALLAEKARLAQENATYARENQFLHEVVQYHQLKLRNITAFPDDEGLAMVDDELVFDSSALDMDFLPPYPPADEDDNVVQEEVLRTAS